MKKSLILLLTLSMLLNLCACESPFTPVYNDLPPDTPGAAADPGISAAEPDHTGPDTPLPSGGVSLRCALSGDDWSIEYEALSQLGTQLSEETGGRCSLTLYPGAVLGEEADTLQMLADGSLDLCVVDSAVLSSVFEDFSILSAPYVFASQEEQELFYETGDLTDLFRSTASSGFTVMSAWSAGSCNLFTRDAPVSSPEDLSDITLGVLESDRGVSPLPLLCGNIVGVRAKDLYPAIQTGVLGGAECDLVSYVDLEYWTAAPYYNKTAHRFLTNELVMANRSLDALSTGDQAVLGRLMKQLPSLCHSLLRSRIADCEDIAGTCGIVFTEADRQAFRTVCEPELMRIVGKTDLAQQVYRDMLALR